MRPASLLLLLLTLLAGCAGMTERECASADWAQLGERDGMAGNRPWIDQYQHQCGRYHLRSIEEDYMDGWRVGHAEYVRRVESHEGGL
jgi:hypothetical protein